MGITVYAQAMTLSSSPTSAMLRLPIKPNALTSDYSSTNCGSANSMRDARTMYSVVNGFDARGSRQEVRMLPLTGRSSGCEYFHPPRVRPGELSSRIRSIAPRAKPLGSADYEVDFEWSFKERSLVDSLGPLQIL